MRPWSGGRIAPAPGQRFLVLHPPPAILHIWDPPPPPQPLPLAADGMRSPGGVRRMGTERGLCRAHSWTPKLPMIRT